MTAQERLAPGHEGKLVQKVIDFEKIEEEHRAAGEDIKWVMVDGFLLYWYAVSAESAWHLTVVSITSTPGCCEDARLQILPPSAA